MDQNAYFDIQAKHVSPKNEAQQIVVDQSGQLEFAIGFASRMAARVPEPQNTFPSMGATPVAN